MKPTKSTVYIPVNTDEPSLVVQEYQREIIHDLVQEKEGYFFTPEQLNEYTANVIKQALETAAEKIVSDALENYGSSVPDCWDKESITNTFEETFKQFEI